MSRSLGRIRKATGDQILVRTGRSMVPTTRALAMRAQVHALVQQAHQLMSAQRELDLAALDLAALDRVFTVCWHDALTAACGTALISAVHHRAPGVRLRLATDTVRALFAAPVVAAHEDGGDPGAYAGPGRAGADGGSSAEPGGRRT